MPNEVVILPSHKIDVRKWDACIARNSNGLIYATSVYLNAMAANWSGLVIDDYNTIMPLPWKKKYSIQYLYTPPFTQQLGIIGNIGIDETQWLHALQRFIKYGTYLFNYSNTLQALNIKACNNYIIDVSGGYQQIQSGYKRSLLPSLAKAAKQQLRYVASNDISETVRLYFSYNRQNINHVTKEDFSNLEGLLLHLYAKEQVVIRKIVNTRDELMSVVLLLKDNKRYYNIINYTSQEGRSLEANYFLYDNLFREIAGSTMLFDFEGSDLAGVKSFYEKFGAANQPYFQWQFNKLPWPLKLLKR